MKEDVKNSKKYKTVYDYWRSNDDGVSVELYTELSEDNVTTRYFIMRFDREWWGGWTSEDTTSWYEISKQEFEKVCNYEIITQD